MAVTSGNAIHMGGSVHSLVTPSSEQTHIEHVDPVIYNDRSISHLVSLDSRSCDSSAKVAQLKSLPLLACENPLSLDDELLSSDLTQYALYFGTGLCTTKEMSAGLPFDILGLIATAEKIRAILGFGKIIQLIADTHAKSNKFVSDDQVDARAEEFKDKIITATQRLGLSGTYQVVLASEFDSSALYVDIYNSIDPSVAHEYVRREWSDMEYLARTENTRLKLSWKMPIKSGKIHKSDEDFFDKGYVAHFQRAYSFISNRASITFDPARLNVCPYTSATGEKRILIQHNEDAEVKLQEYSKSLNKVFDKAVASLTATVALLEDTFDLQLPPERLGIKVNLIIKNLFY